MKRNNDTQAAHELLQHVNKKFVLAVLDNVNLTPQEKDIVMKSEIEKMRLSEIQERYNLSIDSIQRIKRSGMRKIAVYIALKSQ